MDDYWVDFASDEDNWDHHLYWNHYMHFQQYDQYDARTELVAAEQPRYGYNDGTDVIWFASSDDTYLQGADATWQCRKVHLWSQKCDRGRLVFRETLTRKIDDSLAFFLACHELGHAYGFEHHDDTCMRTGAMLSDDPWWTIDGVISQHMIGHINDQY